MNAASSIKLNEQPEIINLLKVLYSNGMSKEYHQVNNLLNYLENMENMYGKVYDELQNIHNELQNIQDNGQKSKITLIVEKTDKTVKKVGEQIHTVKDNLIHSAKNALSEYKCKGVSALKKALVTMKIPNALGHMKDTLNSCAKGLDKGAANIGAIRKDVQSVNEHMSNIGRTLVGKPSKEPVTADSNKGVLVKIQKLYLSCSKLFSGMENATDKAIKGIGEMGNQQNQKPSVKAELKRLKGSNNVPAPKNPKEKAR